MAHGEQEFDEDQNEEARWTAVVAARVRLFMDSSDVLCGEGFLTHEEHVQIAKILETASGRLLDREFGLDDIDMGGFDDDEEP